MYGRSAIINVTAGSAALVTPGATERVNVIGMFFVAGGATNISFEDGAGGTKVCGQMNFAANGGIVSQEVHNPKEGEYLMQTSPGNALVIRQSQTEQIGGIIRYSLVVA